MQDEVGEGFCLLILDLAWGSPFFFLYQKYKFEVNSSSYAAKVDKFPKIGHLSLLVELLSKRL